MGVHISLQCPILFPLDIYPKVELLELTVNPFLIFSETFILFSIVAELTVYRVALYSTSSLTVVFSSNIFVLFLSSSGKSSYIYFRSLEVFSELTNYLFSFSVLFLSFILGSFYYHLFKFTNIIFAVSGMLPVPSNVVFISHIVVLISRSLIQYFLYLLFPTDFRTYEIVIITVLLFLSTNAVICVISELVSVDSLPPPIMDCIFLPFWMPDHFDWMCSQFTMFDTGYFCVPITILLFYTGMQLSYLKTV